MGPVSKAIHGKYPVRYMSYLVKDLGTPLFSAKQHIAYAGCYFHAQDNTVTLAFPAVTMQLKTEPEILFHSIPTNLNNDILAFDYQCASPSEDHGQFKASVIEEVFYDRTLPTTFQETFAESVPFQLLSPEAHLPTRATSGSIGYDVQATASVTITPNSIAHLPTGLACAVPAGMYLKLHNRSSNALKHLTVEGGVIDNDYRGEIQVLLKNNSNEAITVTSNDKIAQMIFENASTPLLIVTTHLEPTKRGKSGFGSSIKKRAKRRARKNRKRGIIHTPLGSIYVDESRTKKPKSLRVARVPTERIHHPTDPTTTSNL